MVLRIKKRTQSQWLVLYAFALPFAFSFLIDLLHLPSFIKYTVDAALIVLLFLAYLNKRIVLDPLVLDLMRVVLVFFAITIIGLFLEYQSIVYYLWGLRNNFRYFIFFAMCTMVLKQEDADFGMRLMDGLFYINVVVTLYQVLVLKVHQDRVGGIFGTSRGCNGFTNIYLMIIVTWYMLRYMCNKVSLLQMALQCGLSLGIAAVAELKMFFIEFVLITALAALMTKFSFRKFGVIILAVAGLVMGLQIMQILFPHFGNWFTLDSIVEYSSSETGYTNANDVNRLSAIPIAWNRFLDTWPRKLFGLGLGNCDYSSNFDFLTSPFYRNYGQLNYLWFSSSFLILETGLVGLLVYVFFFFRMYRAAKIVEKNEPEKSIYCMMARIMSLMALVLFMYNSSLRMECAYMFFFVLALPFLPKSSTGGDREETGMSVNEDGGSHQ